MQAMRVCTIFLFVLLMLRLALGEAVAAPQAPAAPSGTPVHVPMQMHDANRTHAQALDGACASANQASDCAPTHSGSCPDCTLCHASLYSTLPPALAAPEPPAALRPVRRVCFASACTAPLTRPPIDSVLA